VLDSRITFDQQLVDSTIEEGLKIVNISTRDEKINKL
jgi:hypothetical protein